MYTVHTTIHRYIVSTPHFSVELLPYHRPKKCRDVISCALLADKDIIMDSVSKDKNLPVSSSGSNLPIITISWVLVDKPRVSEGRPGYNF